MNDDLILRSALLEAMPKNDELLSYEVRRVICNASAVDAEPVRHGKWVLNKHYGDYECSVCGEGNFRAWDFREHTMNYCPNCGARMDGDEHAAD